MNQEQINKATALIAAGIDDNIIKAKLGIRQSQLDKLKGGDSKPAKKDGRANNGKGPKITEETFNELKAEMNAWSGTDTAFIQKTKLSTATFYRIKRANNYAEYKGFIKASISKTKAEREKAPVSKNYGAGSKFFSKITADSYKELKEAQRMNGGLTRKEFCELYDISLPTYYRIKNSNSYDEYCNKRGKYISAKKTVGIYHEPKKNGDFDIKVKHSPRESQDEVLERIADSLETISYKLHVIIENQAKTKKRGWFRK